LPDRTFGQYELIERIAHGGMGAVYKARQTNHNRVAALKMIRAANVET
jgi:eukaryotic-like serine/threonine-protein kinase